MKIRAVKYTTPETKETKCTTSPPFSHLLKSKVEKSKPKIEKNIRFRLTLFDISFMKFPDKDIITHKKTTSAAYL